MKVLPMVVKLDNSNIIIFLLKTIDIILTLRYNVNSWEVCL